MHSQDPPMLHSNIEPSIIVKIVKIVDSGLAKTANLQSH